VGWYRRLLPGLGAVERHGPGMFGFSAQFLAAWRHTLVYELGPSLPWHHFGPTAALRAQRCVCQGILASPGFAGYSLGLDDGNIGPANPGLEVLRLIVA
jgi:hypothetical protein